MNWAATPWGDPPGSVNCPEDDAMATEDEEEVWTLGPWGRTATSTWVWGGGVGGGEE